MSQTFLLPMCSDAKFGDHWSLNNEVMMGGGLNTPPLPRLKVPKTPMSSMVKELYIYSKSLQKSNRATEHPAESSIKFKFLKLILKPVGTQLSTS